MPSTRHIWRRIRRARFCVLGFTSDSGEPRTVGVAYTVVDGRLVIHTSPGSIKARAVERRPSVSVTIPVAWLPSRLRVAPPATISLQGSAEVRGAPHGVQIVIEPRGEFLTYGVGVPPWKLGDREASAGRAPVG